MRRTFLPQIPECTGGDSSGAFKEVSLAHVYGAYVVLACGYLSAAALALLEAAHRKAAAALKLTATADAHRSALTDRKQSADLTSR